MSTAEPDVTPRPPDARSLLAQNRLDEASAAAQALRAQAEALLADPRPPTATELDRHRAAVADAATLQARIARRADRLDEALRYAGDALSAAIACADAARAAQARAQRAHVLSTLGLAEEGLEEAYAALQAAEASGDARARGVVYGALADVQWTMSRWDDALASYGQMLAWAQDAGDRELHFIAYGGLGGIEYCRGAEAAGEGRTDDAHACYRRSAEHAQRYAALAHAAGDAHAVATGRMNYALAIVELGDRAVARAEIEVLVGEFCRDGLWTGHALALKNLADLELADGEPAAAVRRYGDALAIGERLHSMTVQVACHQGLAEACEAAGDLAAALSHHKRFHALYARVSSQAAVTRAAALEVKHRTETAQALAAFERERAERLERQTLEDGLTGIANRRHFDQALAAAWADRRSRPRCSLALLDIDHFKQVNDRWSHQTGDAVLRRIAQILQNGSRQEDLTARYGGEEFAVLFRELEDGSAALACERMRRAVQEEDWSAVHPGLAVTVSIGWAGAREVEPTQDVESLLRLADARLYAAKRAGRNQVVGRPG